MHHQHQHHSRNTSQQAEKFTKISSKESAGLTVDEILHALGPIIEAVEKRPTERHGRRAQTDGFQDIGAATDAAVDVDFEGVEDVRRVAVEVEEDQDGGRGGVEVAAAVIAVLATSRVNQWSECQAGTETTG